MLLFENRFRKTFIRMIFELFMQSNDSNFKQGAMARSGDSAGKDKW